MKLESRVEALEHELKILKNEIQNTLLEIREQVLNHYYPELRAAETPHPPRRAASSPKTKFNDVRGSEGRGSKNGMPRGSERSSFPGQPQVQAFSDFFLEDDEELAIDGLAADRGTLSDADGWPSKPQNAARRFPVHTIRETQDDEFADEFDAYDAEVHDEGDEDESQVNAAPKLREVQYQQLKQAGATPRPKSKPNPRPARRPFAALAAWVGDSVAKVGKERAIQVVETYAASGNLADDTKSSLLQLITLASDVEPTDPPSNQVILGLMVELDQLLAE